MSEQAGFMIVGAAMLYGGLMVGLVVLRLANIVLRRLARRAASNPPPTAFDQSKPAVWDLVIADMQARDALGRQRYGTPLQPHNGRKALRDAYEEALDQVAYLRQELYEREGK